MGHFGLAWCFSVDFAPLVLHLSLICISDFFTLLLQFLIYWVFARDQVLDFHYQAIYTRPRGVLTDSDHRRRSDRRKGNSQAFCGVHHAQILHPVMDRTMEIEKRKPKKHFKTQNIHPTCLVRACMTD
jgi:hypothetical protein